MYHLEFMELNKGAKRPGRYSNFTFIEVGGSENLLSSKHSSSAIVAGLDPPMVQRPPGTRQTLSFCKAFLIQASFREGVSQWENVQWFQMFLAIEQRDIQGSLIGQHGLKPFKQGKMLKESWAQCDQISPFIHAARVYGFWSHTLGIRNRWLKLAWQKKTIWCGKLSFENKVRSQLWVICSK